MYMTLLVVKGHRVDGQPLPFAGLPLIYC